MRHACPFASHRSRRPSPQKNHHHHHSHRRAAVCDVPSGLTEAELVSIDDCLEDDDGRCVFAAMAADIIPFDDAIRESPAWDQRPSRLGCGPLPRSDHRKISDINWA